MVGRQPSGRDDEDLSRHERTRIDPVRVASGTGLVGSCARNRNIINVPDCYSDARFDPETDRRSEKLWARASTM